jgi:hypothetical protein
VPYREDLDAAQARADALAHEVEKLERENAELREHHEPAAPGPQPHSQSPRPPRRWLRRMMFGLPVALGVGVSVLGITVAVKSCNPHIEGTISASGNSLGTWTVHPTTCQSGQRNQFRGVQFFEDGGDEHGVGYHAPVGDVAFISVNMEHTDKAHRFTARACSVLDGDIVKQSSSINRITNLRGHVKFDCTDGGEHVSGDLTFENCH